MSATHQIQFERNHFNDWIAFTSEVSALRWPRPTAIMNSDIAWQLHGADPKRNVRFWTRHDKIVAFGWFHPPGQLIFDYHPGLTNQTSIVREILHWAIERRKEFAPASIAYLNFTDMEEWAEAIRNPIPTVSENCLVVSALESDEILKGILDTLGFKKTLHFEPMLSHDLLVESSHLTDVAIRPVQASEYDAYLSAHRQAWAPSQGLSMEKYLAVRAMEPVFDPDLNLIAVKDGNILACCIFWRDTLSRIGSLEPFGTVPEGRGTGISSALIRHGLKQLKAVGMEHCRIYTAGFNQPAQKLYQSCGFVAVDKLCSYTKAIA